MQSENETIKEYTEPDGTHVRVRTIVTRTFPAKGDASKSSLADRFSNSVTIDNKNKVLDSFQFESPKRAASASENVVSGASEKFKKEFLDAHNKYRALHGAPPVKLNNELSAYAQQWATHLGETNSFSHRQPNKYGENLFMVGGTNLKLDGADSVKSWYDEIRDYHYFGSEPPMNQFSKFGHFTQVVWKSTTEIGVGLAVVNGNKAYVVGNYNPAGNMIGSFKQNVPAKK